MYAILFITSFVALVAAIFGVFLRRRRAEGRQFSRHVNNPLKIGFLHPHALSGGGGERVLWCAMVAVRQAFPEAEIVLYSAWSDAGVQFDDAVDESKRKIRKQFGLDLGDLSFLPVDIECAHLVEPTRYPRLTLLLQAAGAVGLGAHAYRKYPVDIFVDTANLTFALLLPRLYGAKTVSYVHYPTISTDMLTVVRTRKSQFNNNSAIAKSAILSWAKLLYYKIFALIYAFVALFCNVPLANSSWTRNHLAALWWSGKRIETVFPPCPSFRVQTKLNTSRDPFLIVSVGQFRPEKNHALQLEIMSHLKSRMNPSPRLLMIGGTRNSKDEALVGQLRTAVENRQLPVEIRENVSREELNDALSQASVGLHTMRDEHFGISVVELQAHGLIVVAHRSGGVALDIVQEGVTGILSGDEAEEYAESIEKALVGMSEIERNEMREKAKTSAAKFSDDAFRERFKAVFKARLEKLGVRAGGHGGSTFAR